MKNGYTLVEMLAVVAIFAIITLVALPKIMGSLNKVNKEKYSRFLNDVFLATEVYLEKNIDKYESLIENENKIYISFEELLNSKYLKSTIYDPKNEKTVKDEDFTVEVYFEGDSEYHYKLHETRIDNNGD